MTTPITVRADSLTPAMIGARLKITTEEGVVVEDVLLSLSAYSSFGTTDSDRVHHVCVQFRNCRPSAKEGRVSAAIADYFHIAPGSMVEVVG